MIEDETLIEGNIIVRHRFIFLIIFAITMALFLVGVAMALYRSSGAAQLDLSRPGYASVRSKAVSSNTFDGFAGVGPINESSLKQFRSLYDDQMKQAQAVDAFGGSALDDAALGIDAPAAANSQP